VRKSYLVLNNGDVFEGQGFGAPASAVGELVFTTAVCGYVETLTDPNYAGQIVMQTFPLIGNYGVMEEDFEGECAVKGYVVRDYCEAPSNFRCEYDLDTLLKNKGIPGICGLDTRQLTRLIREQGVMNAMITDVLPTDLSPIHSYSIHNAVSGVSNGELISYPAQEPRFHVAVLNFGIKRSTIEALNKRGCSVSLLPYDTTAQAILDLKPDGLLLSDGPGDPMENLSAVEEVKKLLSRLPIFGMGLGHQILALANGIETVKLPYGHRGANQPVRDLESKKCYITSQNHGYALVKESIGDKGVLRFVNANDGSCEGVDYPALRAFGIQFQLDDAAAPRDTRFLYDRFISMMEEVR